MDYNQYPNDFLPENIGKSDPSAWPGTGNIRLRKNMKAAFMWREEAFDVCRVVWISVILVSISFSLQGNIGINLPDEGFLWYGTIQTAQGDVPIRDFQSYDPGRYYWTSFWSLLLGPGIMSLRMSLGIFQVVGLTLGLLALRRVISSWWVLIVAGFVLLVWMMPRQKVFECSLTLAAVYFAVRLMENPSWRQHLISGVFVGLAAFIGRNHGLYLFLAFALLIMFAWDKLDRTCLPARVGAWVGGMVLGYSPLLIMLLVVPGFFDSFVKDVMAIFSRGTTNIVMEIPWPWTLDYERLSLPDIAKKFTVGVFFLLLPLVYGASAAIVLFCKKDRLAHKKLLVASTFVGIVYLHHIFSRADMEHLAQGIHPFLVALLAIPFSFSFSHKKIISAALMVILIAMSLCSAGVASQYFRKASAGPGQYVSCEILGDILFVPIGEAIVIETVKQIDAQMVPDNEGFLIAPYWPALYPVLQRESPLWDIYFMFPATKERQEQMIQELEENNVNWAILGNAAIDRNDELRFSKTHKILWQYFSRNFNYTTVNGLPISHLLMKRKSNNDEKWP